MPEPQIIRADHDRLVLAVLRRKSASGLRHLPHQPTAKGHPVGIAFGWHDYGTDRWNLVG